MPYIVRARVLVINAFVIIRCAQIVPLPYIHLAFNFNCTSVSRRSKATVPLSQPRRSTVEYAEDPAVANVLIRP